jgi:Cu(I)/Ag(I) efflux system membrane fusion protein
MRQQITFINIILLIFIGIIFISCGADDNELAVKEGQLWTCGMHPEVLLDEPGQCPKCGMNLTPVKQTVTSEAEHEHPAETLYTCPMHPEVLTEEPGSCPKCGMDLIPVKQQRKESTQTGGERKILYWQAPMDPTEIYDHPGKSKMGMNLVPVYEDQVSAGSAITIDPVTVQNMGIRVAPVRRIEFSRILRTTGNIDYNEEKLFTVNSKINGWVEKLYVSFTGQQVRKGQPLLEIYSPELVTTQEEYLLALKNKDLVSETSFDAIREGAESLVNSTKKRLLYWDISPEEIQRLEKERKVRKTITLRAPANGVVTHKNAVAGIRVNEGMNLYQIADLSTVWVYASVYDYEVPWIHLGQIAEIGLSYNPGKIYEGKISYIYPYLNEKARDVRIRIEFPNAKLDLKPGMYANITLRAQTIKDALVIPAEAVLRSGIRNVVFVTREEGKFEPREVKIGEEGENGTLRIISGLLEGEKVVVSAQFLLDSESRLQEAIQKMLAEKHR